ncbi:MAG: ABC transporter ATP-binding protein [Lachnospiraceae bacterium]|nr:ABC transporter ATP-binding protein [Lachnospiraceae bacterium]
MIVFSGTDKKLGSFRLQDINFEIPEGYICGLVGRNGAGKTTLLHLLLGLFQPDAGEVQVDGYEYGSNEKEIRKLLGCVLVDELFDRGLSLADNAEYFGSYYEAYDAEIYHKHLEQFHLLPKRKFKELSKGEKLKCQFAFALAIRPKYLILDEPTANFDPEFRDAFWKILKDFIADGAHSVVLATHLTDDLDRMADRLLFLDKGKIQFDGDMEHFREKYRILSGEIYLINLIGKERILGMEEGKYSTKALVKNNGSRPYPEGLAEAAPSIEEFMYLYSKGGGDKC